MTPAPDPHELPGFWPSDAYDRSSSDWEANQRARTLELFKAHVYGRTPPGGELAQVDLRSRREGALGGSATRTESLLTFAGPRGSIAVALLVYVPVEADSRRPVPAFLGLNFQGNHATSTEGDLDVLTPGVGMNSEGWPVGRGAEARRWPFSTIVQRGYAVATLHYEQLEVDSPGMPTHGVRGLFDDDDAFSGVRGVRNPQAWGSIGAWAWGLSRALDALNTFEEIDGENVFAVGHSRLGKTALWASAQDQRFRGVISNESGCGGASLFRHRGPEDIRVLTSARPQWFAPAFSGYQDADDELPVDQHQLLALQAPRPTHVASATVDPGADPHGEYLSTLHASPMFQLYGLQGTLPAGVTAPGDDLPVTDALDLPLPPVGVRIGGELSYHLRDGEHDMLAEDWDHFLDFADDAIRAE